MSQAEKTVDAKDLRRVAFSSFLGNFIEWFDYASYSYFATIIALVFMPTNNPSIALLETFGVFALSFIMRPIGAVFWGDLGDRKGRKWALMISILIMSGSTFLIGLLPGYASIGIMAPILLLLLRMAQSFSASGEYAGAAIYIAEYAPPKKRGLYCSIVPASTATGLLVGSLFATVMYAVFGHDSAFVVDWGWRIPFLLAGPLGLVVHYIREHLDDSPIYNEMVEEQKDSNTHQPKHPIKLLFTKKYRKILMISFGACMLNAVGFYTVLTYLPNYLIDTVNYDSTKALFVTTICLVTYIAFIFFSGHISDTFGRKKMLIAACLGFIVFTIPAFLLLNTQSFVVILFVELVMCLLLTLNDGTLSSYLTETFPTEVRYSGFAMSFNLANALFGGSASFIAIGLIQLTGNNLAPAGYMVVISIIALAAVILSHENHDKDLSHV